MGYDDIIIKRLAPICETCFLYRPVIDVSGPAVRLNTDCNINLCNFQSTADIPDCIVSSCIFTADYRVFRSDSRHARIQPSL